MLSEPVAFEDVRGIGNGWASASALASVGDSFPLGGEHLAGRQQRSLGPIDFLGAVLELGVVQLLGNLLGQQRHGVLQGGADDLMRLDSRLPIKVMVHREPDRLDGLPRLVLLLFLAPAKAGYRFALLIGQAAGPIVMKLLPRRAGRFAVAGFGPQVGPSRRGGQSGGHRGVFDLGGAAAKSQVLP